MSTVSYYGTHAVRCGECREAFNADIEVIEHDTSQDLFVDVPCRWCKADLVLNLQPFLQPVGVVRKGDADVPMRLVLPEELEGERKTTLTPRPPLPEGEGE